MEQISSLHPLWGAREKLAAAPKPRSLYYASRNPEATWTLRHQGVRASGNMGEGIWASEHKGVKASVREGDGNASRCRGVRASGGRQGGVRVSLVSERRTSERQAGVVVAGRRQGKGCMTSRS